MSALSGSSAVPCPNRRTGQGTRRGYRAAGSPAPAPRSRRRPRTRRRRPPMTQTSAASRCCCFGDTALQTIIPAAHAAIQVIVGHVAIGHERAAVHAAPVKHGDLRIVAYHDEVYVARQRVGGFTVEQGVERGDLGLILLSARGTIVGHEADRLLTDVRAYVSNGTGDRDRRFAAPLLIHRWSIARLSLVHRWLNAG